MHYVTKSEVCSLSAVTAKTNGANNHTSDVVPLAVPLRLQLATTYLNPARLCSER